jgi:hypothetical protein
MDGQKIATPGGGKTREINRENPRTGYTEISKTVKRVSGILSQTLRAGHPPPPTLPVT